MEVKYKKMPRSRGRRFCDELWLKLVRHRDGNKCVICGDTKMPSGHHLISRAIYAYRWEVDNGITVCPSCHKMDPWASFHTAPWAPEEWLKTNRPEQYRTWCERRNLRKDSEPADYDALYYKLEQLYKVATGEYHMISRCQDYVLASKYDLIRDGLKDTGLQKLADICGVGLTALKTFVKKNIELRQLLKAKEKK